MITVNVERGITSNQLPLSTLLCLIFFTGAHANPMLCAHQGEHCCYLIRPLRFSGSFHSSSGFFWGNNKNSRANAASEFVLFIFIYFCVFDSVGRHGHPRIIYSDREFSLYSEMVSILLVLLDSLVAV